MSLAVLFPGQGSITAAAGGPWADRDAWSVVARVEALAERPLAHLLLDDGDEVVAALRTTDAAQLATLTLSLVAWEAAQPGLADHKVIAVAGHSLGQVTALIAAGAVSFDDGIRLATARADA